MSTIINAMLAIRKNYLLFYHKDTNTIDSFPCSKSEMEQLRSERLIPMGGYENTVRLPTYEEVNHEEIMRFYVREFVEDKEHRKVLFNILRRSDYIDDFLDKLHELQLYDDFLDACGSIYIQIFDEWADKNGLKF